MKMQAELDRLRQENEALKMYEQLKKSRQEDGHLKNLTLKISEKGGLSVYGLGRFPITLYREQWVRLLAIAYDSELKAKNARSGIKPEESLVEG